MIGPAPDLGGNVTVMPLCVSCNGVVMPSSPQQWDQYGGESSVVGKTPPVCPVPGHGGEPSSCPNPQVRGRGSGPQVDMPFAKVMA